MVKCISVLLILTTVTLISSQSQEKTCNIVLWDDGIKKSVTTTNDGNGGYVPSNSSIGIDSLFYMLRNGRSTSLVILMDTSLDVRPSHFYLVNRPMVDTLLKYHVHSRAVSISLVTFDGSREEVQCRYLKDDCAEITKCVDRAKLERANEVFWIGDSILHALRKASDILKNSGTLKKLVLIVSSFQIPDDMGDAIEAQKILMGKEEIDIFTVFTSYRQELAIASKVATASENHVDDSVFVEKLYSIAAHSQACTASLARSTASSSNGNMVCRTGSGSVKCICQLGFSGPNCDVPPTYCNETDFCPANSKCTAVEAGIKYSCSCPTCSSCACINDQDDACVPTVQNPTPITISPPGTDDPDKLLPLIIGGSIGGVLLLGLIVLVAILAARRRRSNYNKPNHYKPSDSQTVGLANSGALQSRNGASQEIEGMDDDEDEDLDIEAYVEMSRIGCSISQRGMETWVDYLNKLIEDNTLQHVCITLKDLSNWATSGMKFLPTVTELDTINTWFSGAAVPKSRIIYKGKSYTVLTVEDGILQALSAGSPKTRICFCMMDRYFIVGVRAKTQARGDMHKCRTVVEEIRDALNSTMQPEEELANYSEYQRQSYQDVAVI